MPFWAPDIGIDLGTENVSLYVRGRGVVISEPALVVLDREDRHTVQAVGDEASFLLGRSPDRLTPVYPIRNGLVADFDIAELMLKYFFRKAIGVSYLGKPRVIVSVPCNLDDVNRKALTEAIRYAGAKHVFLIEKPFASAIGTGLPVKNNKRKAQALIPDLISKYRYLEEARITDCQIELGEEQINQLNRKLNSINEALAGGNASGRVQR